MSVTPRKDYVRPVSATWWLKRRTYFLFMLRELTCVFVGGYALLLLLLAKHRDDPQAFAGLLDSPLLIALQLIAGSGTRPGRWSALTDRSHLLP